MKLKRLHLPRFTGTLLMTLAALLAAQGAAAYDFKVNNVAYNYVDQDAKTVSVTFTSSDDNFASNYSGIKTITIPATVTYKNVKYKVMAIGINAFRNSDVTKVTIGSNVQSIGKNAFSSCNNISTLTIPNTVTQIGDGAFSYGNFESVTLPNSLTIISDNLFHSCHQLSSVTIPESVTYIGNEAFYCCCKIPQLNIPNSVTYIGEYAFFACQAATSIRISNSLRTIRRNAFNHCWRATSVYIPESVTTIEAGAFQECKSLKAVNIPNSVTSIGDSAFLKCEGLKKLRLSNKVRTISTATFSNCSLDTLFLPSSVDSITKGSIFAPYIIVDENNTTFDSRDNCNAIIRTNENKLVLGTRNTIIPNTVTSIGGNAFSDSYLYRITIPASVTAIETDAFDCCTGLQHIEFKNVHPEAMNWGSKPFNCSAPFYYVDCCYIYVPYGTKTEYARHINILHRTFIENLKYGDANADGVVDVRDANRIINVVLGDEEANLETDDLNGDGVVDVSDLNIIIKAIMYIDVDVSTIDSDVPSRMVVVNGLPFKMILVKGGDKDFYIGETEVTQELWKTVMGSNPSCFQGNSQLPVEQVNLDDCHNFIRMVCALTDVEFRLPTSDEWLYAARGGQNHVFNFNFAGNNNPYLVAWLVDSTTHCVATALPNEIKLYDMSGNVAEWCSDYGLYKLGSGQAVMGGGYFQGYICQINGEPRIETENGTIRDWDFRNPLDKNKKYNFVGFRLAIDASELDKYVTPPMPYDFMVDGICYNINPGGETVTVTSQLETVPRYVYVNGLQDINIPETVSHRGKTYTVIAIGDHAFEGCDKYTNLRIPATVTTIGNEAFKGCTGLSGTLTIPNSVTAIGDSAFLSCIHLTGTLTIPESVTTIGAGAFKKCRGFSGSLTISESVTTIGESSFYYCDGFTGSLTIGNSVTAIGDSAFCYCSGFTGSLTLGNSVTAIGNRAFKSCRFTGSLTIPNSVTSIGESSFYYCSGFTGSLTIPNSVTEIGNDAFHNCSGFTGSLTIPNSVTEIGNDAFHNCSGFTGSLTIGNSVTSIGSSAFERCSGFTGSLTIPNSVTSIGEEAFSGCSGFTGSLTIGNSVTSIGEETFSGCSGFTGSLTIPNSVTSIGNSAFYRCIGFTDSLTIGNSVTVIGKSAFSGCRRFTGSLTIGNSVTTIGDQAFESCRSFGSIVSKIESPTAVTYGNGIFDSYSKSIPLYVPCGTATAYRATAPWSDFSNITEQCDE